jgi:hypothetical protein
MNQQNSRHWRRIPVIVIWEENSPPSHPRKSIPTYSRSPGICHVARGGPVTQPRPGQYPPRGYGNETRRHSSLVRGG